MDRQDELIEQLVKDNPELVQKAKTLAALEDIKKAQDAYDKRFIPVTIALILIYFLSNNQASNSWLAIAAFIFIFVPRFNLAGLLGFLFWLFGEGSTAGTLLAFYTGFILSSPKITISVIQFFGRIWNKK